MSILNKDFFDGNEVLFVGYSGGKNQPFCKMIYEAFTKNGIKVYPTNTKTEGNYDVKVYRSLSDLPKIPKTAFVLVNKENARKELKELYENGIKRILFQSKRNIDDSILDECSKMGIETIVACPMMKFGTGFHRIHAFFAGVR